MCTAKRKRLQHFFSKRSIQGLPTSQGSWAFQQRDLHDQTWEQQRAHAAMVWEQPGPWRMGSYSEEDRWICQLLQELGQLQGKTWNAKNRLLRQWHHNQDGADVFQCNSSLQTVALNAKPWEQPAWVRHWNSVYKHSWKEGSPPRHKQLSVGTSLFQSMHCLIFNLLAEIACMCNLQHDWGDTWCSVNNRQWPESQLLQRLSYTYD